MNGESRTNLESLRKQGEIHPALSGGLQQILESLRKQGAIYLFSWIYFGGLGV